LLGSKEVAEQVLASISSAKTRTSNLSMWQTKAGVSTAGQAVAQA
jgi:hypothetical protein